MIGRRSELSAIDDARPERGVSAILLDGADAVLEGLAVLLPTLLEGAPDAAWLVTSRAPVGLAGEHVIAVAGLAEDDALALLRGRSPEPRDASEDEALRAIVRATSALPLALRLASARLAREPAARVARSLERDAARGPVRAAIAAAIDALDPEAAAVLGVLAVFEDRFSQKACDAVAGVRSGVSFAALRERGLVERARGDGGPWSRLHDEVRAVARARWQPGQADVLRSRHAAWLARVAPGWAHELHEGEAAPALRSPSGALQSSGTSTVAQAAGSPGASRRSQGSQATDGGGVPASSVLESWSAVPASRAGGA